MKIFVSYFPVALSLHLKSVRSYCKNMEPLSGLSFIDVKHPSNPALLLNEWFTEAKSNGTSTSYVNLATASKQGKVSNRTVVIREVLPEGSLTFTCQRASKKVKDILENPQVAATVLLIYSKEGKQISRQIRFVGVAEQLSSEKSEMYFEKESLHAKIRSWICQDNGPTDWDDLKAKHDELLKEVVENKKVLKNPDTQLAYKIVSKEMEFYHSCGNEIADRILFKLNENGEWNHQRLKA